jgi:signal transduction histidine kinase
MEVLRFEQTHRTRAEIRLHKLFPPRSGLSFVLPVNEDLIYETTQRIRYFLLFLNTCILFAGGGLAYILAGKTLDPLKKAHESQAQFISDASHELKTPLTSLRLAQEIFLRMSPIKIVDATNLAHENIKEIDQMHELIDTLINMSKLDQARQPQHPHIQMKELIASSVSTIQNLAQTKQILISDTHIDASIRGDMRMLQKLMVILLENAIKYSHAHTTISISGSIHGKWYHLSVTDQGEGIPEHDMPHIFTRFYRGDAARTRNIHAGHGLGLAIAQKIAQIHRTEITVKSKVGHGSTFSLRLPLA